MNTGVERKFSHLAEVVVQETMMSLVASKMPPPEYVEEARFDLIEAESAFSAQKSANADRAKSRRELISQDQEQKAKAEEEFGKDGRVSAETSVALSSLEKSLAKVEAAVADDSAALQTARQNVALRRSIYEKTARQWAILDKDGPASEANALIRDYLEFLPLVMLKSAQIYDEARTKFGWKVQSHPLPYWYGPAGALLDNLQEMTWPDWPESLRPTWVSRTGAQPTMAKFLEDHRSAVNRLDQPVPVKANVDAAA